jgi:hypothetical protein
MTMRGASRPAFTRVRGARLLRAALLAAVLAVLLAACGSAGKGLIPSAHAGPLLGDFEEVQKAAESGGGDCTATESALAKTKEDFAALPSSVDRTLRLSLHNGISNLANRALQLCAQPLTSTTQTTTTPARTTQTTTTNTTPTTPAKTTPATTTPPSQTPPSGGGTPAPEEGAGAGGSGEEKSGGAGEEGAGGAGPGEGAK